MKKISFKIPHFKITNKLTAIVKPLYIFGFLTFILLIAIFLLLYRNSITDKEIGSAKTKSNDLVASLEKLQKEYDALANQDQIRINSALKEEISSIHQVFQKSSTVYENITDLRPKIKSTATLDAIFAKILSLLSDKKYQEANAQLKILEQKIAEEKSKLAAVPIPINVPANNAPPGSGYRRQKVNTDSGDFLVDIVAADLNNTKVIIDTASDSDCSNNCPVLALADYVSRSGAFAGVNGPYFCPATYPSCAGKTNSFDTLLMNKNKKYFNSDNNVYSTIPAAIFYGNTARFVAKSLEWGRDTGVDAVIANYPLLVLNSQIVFSGDGEAKHNSKGNRGFVANTGNVVYIGVVHSATVLESAKVMKALGVNSALNLDDGGSTALWSNGYKVGPGRQIPNAVLLIKK